MRMLNMCWIIQMVKHTAVKLAATQNHTKKSCNEKGSRAIKSWCLQIQDKKCWQCARDHWKSIAANRGWYHQVKNAANLHCVCHRLKRPFRSKICCCFFLFVYLFLCCTKMNRSFDACFSKLNWILIGIQIYGDTLHLYKPFLSAPANYPTTSSCSRVIWFVKSLHSSPLYKSLGSALSCPSRSQTRSESRIIPTDWSRPENRCCGAVACKSWVQCKIIISEIAILNFLLIK